MSRFIVIGNPNNRRISLFQAALQRCKLPKATIIPYLDLLTKRLDLKNIIQAGDIIRIESPGEDFAVEQKLIELGVDDTISIKSDMDNYEYGRIYYPRFWYKGFSILLRQMQTEFENLRQAGTDFTVMNPPLNILTMFNKPQCHQLCQDNNLPVAPSFNSISSYEQLRELMIETGQRRVFVKLAYGSSASGVVAYEIDGRGEREQAHTSVELTYRQGFPILYNSLKIRRYTKHQQIKAIIDWLCHEGVHVEHWLPKAHHNGKVYDLRVVVIAGKARHSVVRLSHTPLTNLHLGNARCTVNELQLPEHILQNIKNTAEQGAALFADNLYVSLDIMLPLRGQTPVILEMNAFGDLLLRISDDGMDTYQAELSQIK